MTEAVLGPDETRLLSVWGLLGKRRVSILRWGAAVFFGVLALLGGLAFISRYRPNEVWNLFSALGSNFEVYLICLGVSGATASVALLARQRAIAALGFAVTGYLGAYWLSGLLYRTYNPDVGFPLAGIADAVGFAIQRLWLGIPAVAALGVAALLLRGAPGEPRPHLGLGDWSVVARDASAKGKPHSYWRKVIEFGIFTIVVFVLLQATVGFRPVLSGKIITLAPAILIAAIVNATVEEFIYRGFLQPAFMRALGVGAGIWATSALFGLLHWGISFGVLAALPVSLGIALGSVFWGKAAYDTRGISWPIAAHFLIDIAIFSTYFV
jgi:membrane protease YdiL (CAAX protease family)